MVVFLRVLFFTSLLIALAQPYIEKEKVLDNSTSIKVLVDDSWSMQLYDSDEIVEELRKSTGLSLDVIQPDLKDYSSIGNFMLNHMAPDENMILITDGQNNFGPSLSDVALFASSINAKIFAMKMNEDQEDAGIVVEGPSKVVIGVEDDYTVRVNEVGSVGKKVVKVFIDDELVHDEIYSGPITITRKFIGDEHVIKAVLETTDNDYFEQNNIFYKTVKVLDKPKVLFISGEESPMLDLYGPLYEITVSDTLDVDLERYHSVVLNNVHAQRLSEDDIDKLEEYVLDGNGLFVIGGKSSYDYGEYNRSLLSNILPVSVGKAKKNVNINMVILYDTGGSLDLQLFDEDIAKEDELQKLEEFSEDLLQIALNMVRRAPGDSNLGVVEAALPRITYNSYEAAQQAARQQVSIISKLSKLEDKRDIVVDEMAVKRSKTISLLHEPYRTAHEMLRVAKGTKLIMIISDGNFNGPYDRASSEKLVQDAYNDGIRTHTYYFEDIGYPDYMKKLAQIGGGEYNTIGRDQNVVLHFGGSVSREDLGLHVYDSHHFITEGLEFDDSRVFGFNGVYPKSTARMIISTTAGDPILTVWNFGLGRVAALSTDDGTSWVPGVLSKENSISMIKTLNWIIEDPQRKQEVVIDIPSLRKGENNDIVVQSDKKPVSQFNFIEVRNGVFEANYFPNETGITKIMGSNAAVNYEKEYLNLGISDNLNKAVQVTGGEMLDENIGEKIKSVTKVTSIETDDLDYLFILIAIAIYLTELFIRRVYRLKTRI